MPEDFESLRHALRHSLPARIAAVTESYAAFAQEEAPADAQGFAAHHAACKAALAHMDQLLKLARWAERDNSLGAAEEQDEIAGLLARARHALGEDDEEMDEM